MSKDGFVQVPPNSTGGKVDCASLSVAGQTVVRQRIVIGDNASSANFATVTGGALLVTGALSVGPISTIDRISATVTVAGNVTLGTGTNHVGTVDISGMPAVNVSAMPKVTVSGTALIAGVVTLGANVTVDAISATVNVAGTVAISTLPNINISSMPAISVGPISTIDKISATVTVAGTVNISSMPAISVGPITSLDRISATVTVAGSVGINSGTISLSGKLDGISSTVTVAGNITIDKISATATMVIGGFLDPSGQQRNLVDSANLALRVNVVAGSGAGANPVSIAAGTSNIGFINNISATVTVAGNVSASIVGTVPVSGNVTVDKISATASVVLAAGTANIGTLNNISAAVSVTLPANIGTVNNISAAVVLAAGANNIGSINNISAQVAVSGSVTIINNINISAMPNVVLGTGTNHVGTVDISGMPAVAISGTAVTVNAYRGITLAVPSASHGPKTVTLSSSATTALIAAPGVGVSAYIDGIIITNGAAALAGIQIYEASATGSPVLQQYLAANGGGFAFNFDPPWKVSANTALNARLKPSASQVLVTINFHVA